MKINLVARTNGVGLDRDVEIMRSALSDFREYDITVSSCRSNGKLRRKKDFADSNYRPVPLLRRLPIFREKYDANIFLERIYPRWFGRAKLNILIPNQEFFPKSLVDSLEKIDHVLCKTQHAAEIFRQHCRSVHTIGFTSNDMLDDSIVPDYQKFFHLAGSSPLKGTETLLALWERNPAWPPLTLIQRAKNAPDKVPNNVHLITDYLSNEEIKQLQNSHGIHLCTSRSEGWGHYIVEATSCRALVVSTDGPPMNELISPDHGMLVPWNRQEPRNLGTDWFVDPDQLEIIINKLIAMPLEEKQQLGKNARHWYETNHLRFGESLPQALSKMLATSQHP
ncbi:glycosyl transferase [Oceaniferula spumae]|uniref:Glycosyl transferase n=1 Tax=Oceaniferula spumae TaxID=2979115 RepID=A0AAT9FRD8_9BACT